MPHKILVATPHPAFGELLRISLEENGPYQVRLAQSGREAQASAELAEYAVAILDADLSDPEMPEVARALQDRQPQLRLLVIPLENQVELPQVAGVRVDGQVKRPYYLPELLQDLQTLLSPAPVAAPQLDETLVELPELAVNESAPFGLPWQRDAAAAAAQLGELTGESAADSLIILRGRELYAWSGKISQEEARKVCAELSRYWDGSQKSDLVRFLVRESPEQDSLLYATALADEYLLALVYDIPIPLTRCRAQSGRLVRLLMTAPEEEAVALPAVQAGRVIEELPAAQIPYSPAGPQVEAVSALEEALPTDDAEAEPALTDENEEAMAASLSALLQAMPQPDPTAPGEIAPTPDFRFPWEVEQQPVPGAPQAEQLLPAAPLPPVEIVSAQEESVWLTAGGEPVNPAAQAEGEQPVSDALSAQEPAPCLQPAPVEEIPARTAEATIEDRLVEPLPAWMAQALAAPSAQAKPPTAAQPLAEPAAQLPLEPMPRLPWEEPEPQADLSEASMPPTPAPRPDWEVEDTQPLRVQKPAPAPAERPDLEATRRAPALQPAPSSEVPQPDRFLADTHPRRALGQVPPPPAQEKPEPPPETSPHQLSPAPASEYIYTCVLLPKNPKHYLVGPLTDLLRQTMLKIALHNHWKVRQVLVRPQYLQWVTVTDHLVPPEKIAEAMRKYLSAVLIKQYPVLKTQISAGNFWSPDILAQEGSDPIPVQRLRSLIRQARENT